MLEGVGNVGLLLPPSRQPHLLSPVTSSTQPAESGLYHLPWRSLTCPPLWGRYLQLSALPPSLGDAVATLEGLVTTLMMDDDALLKEEQTDNVLTTQRQSKAAVNDTATTLIRLLPLPLADMEATSL